MIDAVLGILCGFVSGLIPGFYITQILLFSNSFDFIVASTISFLFAAIFPAVLISCPNSENHLIVLPSFKMIKQGKAMKALDISLFSLLASVFFSLFFLLLMNPFLEYLYQFVKFLTPYLLVISLVFLVKDLNSIIIIALCSILGCLIFDFNLLIPMLTGFFGLSAVIASLYEAIPVQKIVDYYFRKFEVVKTSVFSGFVSSVFAFVPAVSSNMSAMFSKLFFNFNDETFMAFAASTNMYYVIFSFFGVFLINKARTGPAFFLLNSMTIENAFYTLGIVFVSAVVSFFFANAIKRRVVFFFQKFRKNILIASIFLVIFLNAVFFGFYGLLVLATSTLVGLLCYKLDVAKITCMASMIVPALLLLI